MSVVETRVEAFGQLPDSPLRTRVFGRSGLPAPVAVSNGSCSLPSVRCQKSPRMALAHPHQCRRLFHRHLSCDDSVQHLYPRLLLHRQRQSSHRLTFSLNS